MKSREVVRALGALAHEYRLKVYRLLIREGPEGLPAGAIGVRVGLAPSSLTFHLQALQRAGLVRQARAGRQLFYSADYSAMNGLVGLPDGRMLQREIRHATRTANRKVAIRKSRSTKAA